jgi:hypothetical protein
VHEIGRDAPPLRQGAVARNACRLAGLLRIAYRSDGSRLHRWPARGGPWGDSLYFAFTGPTIGYGDFVPRTVVGRLLSILIGIGGILLTGLVVAVGVKALNTITETDRSKSHDH